mgnify:CR=1 FL=1|tara:strand:- start:290 stop:760 length:471 start_codon:yes stop_codon:yes gene_type:complete
MLIIQKNEMTNQKLHDKLLPFLKKIKSISSVIRVYDIHNTIEYNNGIINEKILQEVLEHKSKSIIIFLSYDGQEDRMKFNNKVVTKAVGKVPVIFIKRREKGKIIYHIYDILTELYSRNFEVHFTDDKVHNLKNALHYAKKYGFAIKTHKVRLPKK